MSLREVIVLDSVSGTAYASLARNDGRIFSFLIHKDILPSNEYTREDEEYKSERVNDLFYLWRNFVPWIHDMNSLIHEDDETSSTIECWKWEEIKYSQTQRYHRRENNQAPNLYSMISQANKNSTDSNRTAHTGSGFFFLFIGRVCRKTRHNNRRERSKRKSYLLIHLEHTMSESSEGTILESSEGNIGSDVCTDFTIYWCQRKYFLLASSNYLKYCNS